MMIGSKLDGPKEGIIRLRKLQRKQISFNEYCRNQSNAPE